MLFADSVVEVKDSLDSYFELVVADILEVVVGNLGAVVDTPEAAVAGILVDCSFAEKGILVVVAAEDSRHSWVVEHRSLGCFDVGLPMWLFGCCDQCSNFIYVLLVSQMMLIPYPIHLLLTIGSLTSFPSRR